MRKITGLMAGLLLILCTSAVQAQVEFNNLQIKRAKDANPDPFIFETTIVAAPKEFEINGETVTLFSYNGQIPGPEIRVKRGDRVIVHLKNELPEGFPTTIHWHGIELNNESDGSPVTQDLVMPGGTYTYDFIVPRGGVFWYHPHARGSQEVSAGLYAPLIVREPEERDLVLGGVLPFNDLTMVLSDLSIVNGEPKDIESTLMLETMNGVEGENLLVNGKVFPSLKIREGQAVRLRLINASITRYFRLVLPGHTIYRVGGEGGLIPNVRVEGGMLMGMRMAMDPSYTGPTGMVMIDQGYNKGEILLTPAQRADVVIVPNGKAGDRLVVQWADYARGRHQMKMNDMGMMMTEADDDGLRPSIDLFEIRIKKKLPNCKFYGATSCSDFAITEGDTLVAASNRLTPSRTDSQIKLQSDMTAMMMGMPKSTWFKIDGVSGINDRQNYRVANVGEVIEWETHNHTDMHHPFHLHGFSYQPTRFVKMNHEEGYMDMWSVNMQNEYVDTVNVPSHTSVFYNFEVTARPGFGAAVGSTAGDGAKGDWVFHCHIFQHGENGMMSFLRVE